MGKSRYQSRAHRNSKRRQEEARVPCPKCKKGILKKNWENHKDKCLRLFQASERKGGRRKRKGAPLW